MAQAERDRPCPAVRGPSKNCKKRALAAPSPAKTAYVTTMSHLLTNQKKYKTRLTSEMDSRGAQSPSNDTAGHAQGRKKRQLEVRSSPKRTYVTAVFHLCEKFKNFGVRKTSPCYGSLGGHCTSRARRRGRKPRRTLEMKWRTTMSSSMPPRGVPSGLSREWSRTCHHEEKEIR